jgi:hypothetical protein
MFCRKTPLAARELQITVTRLYSLLRSAKIPAPQKDSSGDYLWTDTDLEAVRRALAIDHRRKDRPA